jgi:hypothetical protein
MISKTFLTTAVAGFLLLARTGARADSFTLGFNADSAEADAGGLVQIGYSFTNNNPS